MSILHILTVIFVIAKLAAVINWSWWLVLAPSIIGAALALVILIAAGLIAYWAD